MDRCDLKWKYLFPRIISQPVKLQCVWQLIPERNVHLHNNNTGQSDASKPQAALYAIPAFDTKVQPRMVNVTKTSADRKKAQSTFHRVFTVSFK